MVPGQSGLGRGEDYVQVKLRLRGLRLISISRTTPPLVTTCNVKRTEGLVLNPLRYLGYRN